MLEWLIPIAIGAALGSAMTWLSWRHAHGEAADVRAELASELERARRYGRSFHLARVSGDGLTPREMAASTTLGIRRTDRVWQLGGSLYVLLPECERTACDRWVHRLQTEFGDGIEVRTACFPHDGLTLDTLLRRLALPNDAVAEVGRPELAPAEDRIDGRTQVAS